MENLERIFNERKIPVPVETAAVDDDLTQLQQNDEVFSAGEETVDPTRNNDSNKATESNEVRSKQNLSRHLGKQVINMSLHL